MRVPPVRVLGLLIPLLVVTGCGDDGDAPTSPSPTATASATATSSAGGTDANAAADITAAQAAARSDGRKVLVVFGADWCPDCQVLAKHFQNAQVSDLLAAEFHVVKVDVGQFDKNLDLSKRYGDVVANGIPALVVLDRDGQVLTTTKSGSFANARTMTAAQVRRYLAKWSR